MGERRRVIFVYPYIPHYRKPVFEELAASERLDCEFWSDVVPEVPNLRVLVPGNLSTGEAINSRWLGIKNRWFFRHFLWQSGVIPEIFRRPDATYVFLGNMYYVSTWVATLLIKLRHGKVYYWTHGVRKRERGLKGILRVAFYSLADGIFLYGERAKTLLVSMGNNPAKLHLVYNSLDYASQNNVYHSLVERDQVQVRRSYDFEDWEKVVITAGRLTRAKRVDLLIDAIYELRQSSTMLIKLYIVGDGPERKLLERQVNALGIQDCVVMYGECYDEKKMGELLYLADVACIAGDIGLFAMHALTFGTPVITHDDLDSQKPEYEAICAGFNGDFYEFGNVSSLAKILSAWIRAKELSGMREACRKVIVEKYNPRVQREIFEAVLASE